MKFHFLSFFRNSQDLFGVLFAVGLALAPAPSGTLWAQGPIKSEDLNVIPGTARESDYQEMLMKYLLNQAGAQTQKRLEKIEALRTEADIKAWSESNRRKFLELIGGLPNNRTPLNAHVVGEVARDGYVIRKVIYESLPEFYVTANLYVPTTGKPPYPAVLSPCGHSENGKAYDVYQHLFVGLVKRGYVVLTYDPLGQGERIQYWDFFSGKRRFTFNQHGMAGIQEYLIGQNLARYFIWDGMRSLDYLASLPEVDAARIGVTGSSGGGTLTTYITMLDPRVKAASIVTFITSIPKKIENRINDAESDPEQDIAGLLPAGIDHPEFLGMIAPRPVLLGAAIRDFFPIEGTRQTFAEAQQIYGKLDVRDHIKMVEFDHRHMYSQPLREATYAWFDRWLKGIQNEVHEPAIVTEKDSVLECTPTGQVLTSMGGKTVADFNRAETEKLLGDLKEKRPAPEFQSELAAKIKARLGLAEAQSAMEGPQKVDELTVSDLVVEKYLLASEPGIVVPTRVLLPKTHAARVRAVVYLRDRDGRSDLPAMFEEMARQGRMVVVSDVRGFGETMSAQRINDPHLDYFDPRDGMDADFTFASFFLGRPLLGMRVRDARAVIDFVRTRPEVESAKITLAGRGWAGVVALFTAALDPGISSLAVEDLPVSYEEIAAAHLYDQPVSLMLPGVLRDFDLQDVLASLAPRPSLVLNPENAMGRKMDRDQAGKILHGLGPGNVRAHTGENFEVEVVPIESDARATLVNWISRQ